MTQIITANTNHGWGWRGSRSLTTRAISRCVSSSSGDSVCVYVCVVLCFTEWVKYYNHSAAAAAAPGGNPLFRCGAVKKAKERRETLPIQTKWCWRDFDALPTQISADASGRWRNPGIIRQDREAHWGLSSCIDVRTYYIPFPADVTDPGALGERLEDDTRRQSVLIKLNGLQSNRKSWRRRPDFTHKSLFMHFYAELFMDLHSVINLRCRMIQRSWQSWPLSSTQGIHRKWCCA